MEGNRARVEQPRLPQSPGPSSFPGHGAGGSLPRRSRPSPAVWVPDVASVYGAMFPPWPAWRPLQTRSCLDAPRLAEDGEHSLPPPAPATPALLIPSAQRGQECLAYSGGRASHEACWRGMNHGPRLPSAHLGRVRGWPCPELMGRREGRRAGSWDGQTEQFAGERCLLDSSLGAAQKLCYRILAAWKQRIDFSEFHRLKCKTHGMSHGGPRCQGLLCRWGRGGSERAERSAPGHGGGGGRG